MFPKIYLSLLSVALIIFKISFFNHFPFIRYLNLPLFFILYLLIKNTPGLFIIAFLSGYFLDIFSSYTFGVHTLALLLAAIGGRYFYCQVMAVRRFSFIILLIIAIAIYNLTIILTILFLNFLKIAPKINLEINQFFFILSREILYSLLFGLVSYGLIYLIRKNFKESFLRKGI